MRIALLTSFFPPDIQYDGIARYVEDLAFALTNKGMDVTVISGTSGSMKVEQNGLLTIYRIPSRRRGKLYSFLPSLHHIHTSFKFWRILKTLHEEAPFDIIEFPNTHVTGIMSLALGLPSPHPAFVERLSTPRAVNPKNGIIPSLNVLLESWQTRHSHALISNSKTNLEVCNQVYGLPEHIPSCVIPHGLSKIKKTHTRIDHNHEKIKIFFLGRMNKRKGFDILASAWPSIAEHVPSAQLIVAGVDLPCEHGDSFFHWSTKNLPSEAKKRIKFYGKVSSKKRDFLYQEAYICVMPSRYESFGLVALEAMQLGTPVISTTVGGIPEVIKNGITGLLVPSENPVELSKAVINLIKDKTLYNNIRENMKVALAEKHSIDQVAFNTIEYYKSIKRKMNKND